VALTTFDPEGRSKSNESMMQLYYRDSSDFGNESGLRIAIDVARKLL